MTRMGASAMAGTIGGPRAAAAARAGLVASLAATFAAAAVTTAPAAHADPVACRPADDPTAASLMIVGDSVAQGSVDDWTWRYRLWNHLTTLGAAVDFVGPNDDVYDRQVDEFGSHDYADPDFDRDHAAHWGMSFADQEHPIGDLVTACRPEVVVEALGFNDLTWWGASPDFVLTEARAFVADARSADPSVDIVLCQLPQTWYANVAAYNQALPALAAELDTTESRVATTDTGAGFTEFTDTYDPAHLSATGEVKMAAGVADVLAALGIGGPYARPLPEVDNGPTRPAALSVDAGDGQAQLSWSLPPGATGVYVWVRDATAGEQWRRLPYGVDRPAAAWMAGGLTNYHVHAFRLQAAKGSVVAEHLFSDVVTARPHKPAPGPVILNLKPGPRRLTARWTTAKRATGYVVTWKRRGTAAAPRTRRTTSTQLRLRNLVSRQRYRVTVTALNEQTPGRTAIADGRPR